MLKFKLPLIRIHVLNLPLYHSNNLDGTYDLFAIFSDSSDVI